VNYAISALDSMDERGAAAFDLHPAVQDTFNEELQGRLEGSVWNSGCSSWYLDGNGRNSIQWPGFTFEYRRRTRRFDAADYRLSPRAPLREAVPALTS
jgi:hypothetical protein